MFRVTRLPLAIVSFFEPHRDKFHWDHFEYFQTFVFLIALAWGRRNVSNLCRHLAPKAYHHRERFNNFLIDGRWVPEEELRAKAHELLSRLKLRKGEVIELIGDDSKKDKRGKCMEAVLKLRDPVGNCFMRGHLYVVVVLRVRGYTIPWGIRLYVKKEECEERGLEFRKTTELLAEMIREFTAPVGVCVRVLFDSCYLCQTVVSACRAKGYHFFSTLKGNRNLFKNGRKLKARQYGRNLWGRRKKQHFCPPKGDGRTEFSYVDADWVNVSNLGPLHVVFSRKGKEPGILGIVTDDPDLSASGIIEAYGHRWTIEVFFKDTKQLLGLGQYQNGAYHAAVTHLHLVCFAYALLTHLAIERDGEKGKTKNKASAWTTGSLQNELRRMAWEDLADRLKTLKTGDEVVQELEKLLFAA
jgi:SRSO17 transposase